MDAKSTPAYLSGLAFLGTKMSFSGLNYHSRDFKYRPENVTSGANNLFYLLLSIANLGTITVGLILEEIFPPLFTLSGL